VSVAVTVRSRQPAAFTAESEQVALLLTAHAGRVTGAQYEQQLTDAVGNRKLIGQARDCSRRSTVLAPTRPA